MKVRFVTDPKGRPEFKKDAVVEFKGQIEEGYARKYIARKWAVEIDEAAERVERRRMAEEERDRKKLEERAAVVIPDGFAELAYPELRALAVSLTDDKVTGRDDAIAVIEAERVRRAQPQQ